MDSANCAIYYLDVTEENKRKVIVEYFFVKFLSTKYVRDFFRARLTMGLMTTDHIKGDKSVFVDQQKLFSSRSRVNRMAIAQFRR